MSEYYAVIRSTDHLAHYGVKGMKWGVRKAIEKGNTKALARHYKKAQKKLEKLNKRMDIETQNSNAKKYNKIAKISGKIGGIGTGLAIAGTGTDHTLHYINSLHKKITKNKLDDLDRKSSKTFDDHWSMIVNSDKQYREGKISKEQWERDSKEIQQWHTDDQNKIGEEYNKVINDFNKGKDARKTAADIGRHVGYIGAGVGALGLGTAAIAKGKAIAAKRRTTAKGHAKAISNRNSWKHEMDSAFKGTKYDTSKKSYKDLVKTFAQEEKKDNEMYKNLKNKPFGKTRIKYNIGKKAHNFKDQELYISKLGNEIYKRQNRMHKKNSKKA